MPAVGIGESALDPLAAFAPPPEAPPAVPPAPPPLGVPAAITHLSMFAALAWFLSRVAAFKVVYEDLGTELPILPGMVMAVNKLFESVGLPLWLLAILGLALDFSVWWDLRRRGRYKAAENWLWIVAAAIIPVTLVLQQILLLPLFELIYSMK